MNPAALKTNLPDLPANGILILNANEFNKRNLMKAKLRDQPARRRQPREATGCSPVELTKLTRTALEDSELDQPKDRDRCKNFFALGMVYWMFSRPLENTVEWLHRKFKPSRRSPTPTSRR